MSLVPDARSSFRMLVPCSGCSFLVPDIILDLSQNEQNITKMKNSAGKIKRSCTEIADILNEYFATIDPILASKIPKTNKENLFPNIRGDPLYQIQKKSKVEVEKIIKDSLHKNLSE